METLWVGFVGLVAGVLTGLFGFGGGWLLVPLLVLPGAMGWAYASGTALCAILAGATGGMVRLALVRPDQGRVSFHRRWRAVAATMAASATSGTILGKIVLRDWLAGFRQASLVLDVVLAIVLVVVAARFFVGAVREAPDHTEPTARGLALAGLLVFIPGLLSGLIGIGGGIFYVPVILFILGWSEDEARAISRLVVVASALVGAALYGWGGGVRPLALVAILIPAGVAGVLTSKIGFSHTTARRRLFRRLAGTMALLALVFTIIHMAGKSAPTTPTTRGGPLMAVVAAIVPLVWGAACGLAGLALRTTPSPTDDQTKGTRDERQGSR